MVEEEEEEEDDEEGEDEDEEGEEEAEEDEAAIKQRKKDNALKDIDIIRDIFYHIDETSERITVRLAEEEENSKMRAELEKYKSKEQDSKQQRNVALGHVSWEEYDVLDDGQRADLLEKALSYLATHNDD